MCSVAVAAQARIVWFLQGDFFVVNAAYHLRDPPLTLDKGGMWDVQMKQNLYQTHDTSVQKLEAKQTGINWQEQQQACMGRFWNPTLK